MSFDRFRQVIDHDLCDCTTPSTFTPAGSGPTTAATTPRTPTTITSISTNSANTATSITSSTTDHEDDQYHHDRLLLVAEPWGARGGTLAQVVDDLGVVSGRPVNAAASALPGHTVHHPAVLGPGALVDARE
jgi:hypothetical protein